MLDFDDSRQPFKKLFNILNFKGTANNPIQTIDKFNNGIDRFLLCQIVTFLFIVLYLCYESLMRIPRKKALRSICQQKNAFFYDLVQKQRQQLLLHSKKHLLWFFVCFSPFCLFLVQTPLCFWFSGFFERRLSLNIYRRSKRLNSNF